MKRLLLIVGAFVLLLLAFWVGLMFNFPGAAVSRYVEGQVNRFPGMKVRLSPAELRWTGLRVPEAELIRRGNEKAVPLLTLHELSIPLTWRLISGLSGQAVVGKTGDLHVFMPWGLGEAAEVDGRVVLEEIPVPEVFQPVQVKGTIEVSGRFRMDQPLPVLNQFPEGSLRGRMDRVEIAGLKVGSFAVPVTRLDSARLEVDTGPVITVKTLTFQGDLQGNVEGTINPNVRNPRLSRLGLKVTAAARNSWLASFGDMQPVVQSFFSGGRLVLQLQGVVGQPRIQQARGS